MKYKTNKLIAGFTLIEMLLVMVIISIIIYAGIGYVQQRTLYTRIDRTGAQMQQILNAGLSYYVDNGKWPTQLSDLQGKYLPPSTVPLVSPWGESYSIYSYPIDTNNPSVLYVWTRITSAATTTQSSATAAATSVAGLLPFGYTTSQSGSPPPAGTACTGSSTTCYVVSSVNIPGQNLNNARAVNFAGLYHHGACVPVPVCPVDASNKQLIPEIMVVPVSVSGLNDPNSHNVYPISSFTAYATSNNNGKTPTNITPPPCDRSTPDRTPACNNQGGPTSSAYWRVCLQVVTEKGDVQYPTRTDDWGKLVTVMAITRCAVNKEPSGSSFDVYSN